MRTELESRQGIDELTRAALYRVRAWVATQDGSLRYLSVEDLEGREKLTGLIGTTDHEIFEPADAAALAAAKRNVLRTGEPVRAYAKLLPWRDEPRTFEMTILPMGESGEHRGVFVTAWLPGPDELASQEEDDDPGNRFAEIVAHQIQSPVTAIAGLAEILERNGNRLGEEMLAEVVELLRKESMLLQATVSDLLQFARAESDSIELEPVRLQRWLPRLIETNRMRWREVPIEVAVDANLPPVSAHPGLLEQILLNLIDNGVKYAKSPITVTAGAYQDLVQVSVLDRGPGVPCSELDAIFQPFRRGSNARRVSTGTGLGLAITRKLVAVQRGRIWAEPRDGGGLCFSFTLQPLADPGDE